MSVRNTPYIWSIINNKTMKKGTKIQVKEDAKYNGQTMNWTETYTGVKEIKKGGEWVFHKSDNLIKSFVPKEICVSPFEYGKSYLKSNATKKEVTSKYNWKQYIYAIFLTEGTKVDTYSDDEYRFEINETTKIIFAGTIIEANGPKNEKGNSTYIKYSDTIKL